MRQNDWTCALGSGSSLGGYLRTSSRKSPTPTARETRTTRPPRFISTNRCCGGYGEIPGCPARRAVRIAPRAKRKTLGSPSRLHAKAH
jgi:hypothetical protein